MLSSVVILIHSSTISELLVFLINKQYAITIASIHHCVQKDLMRYQVHNTLHSTTNSFCSDTLFQLELFNLQVSKDIFD